MNFKECVGLCIEKKELVSTFDRLRGTNLMAYFHPARRLTPIEAMIDLVCKTEEEDSRLNAEILLFIEFVRDCIWERSLAASQATKEPKP